MNMHFIAGLPRSGSTLLSALLNQNPDFAAGMTSPVLGLINAVQPKLSGDEFAWNFDDARKKRILSGVFESYYHRYEPSEHPQTIFDTNRMWTSKLELIDELYPAAKVICCVREIGWIVDSMERIIRKHPLQVANLFKLQPYGTVYSRVKSMMDPEDGLIGAPLSALKQAWYSKAASKLILVPYDSLVSVPNVTMYNLYHALGETFFQHDFDKFSFDVDYHDVAVGIPGLHKVEGPVRSERREPCVPADIFVESAPLNFWLSPAVNKGATVL